MDLKSRFPQIGSSGTKPEDGKAWEEGENYWASHVNYIWNNIRTALSDIENWVNTVDSDGDGVVDEADYANDADASTYKGNDIDSNGDGEVDWATTARDSEQLGGDDPSTYHQDGDDASFNKVEASSAAVAPVGTDMYETE